MSDNSKLTAALDHARRGFRIFPLAPNSKEPIAGFADWPEKATAEPSQIRQWWDQWPNANIGILASGYLIVDIDPRNGGVDSFDELKRLENVPKTLAAKTWSGGAHCVYKLPAGIDVKNGAHRLGRGLDVKGKNGYVVGAGSTIDGKAYKWANGRPIAEAPQWMIDRCQLATERGEAAGKRIVPEDDTAVQLARDWLEKHAPKAEDGAIDNTAYKVAARFYDFGVSVDTAIELLCEWSDRFASPPMEMPDINRVARSASRNRENTIGARHPSASGFEPVEIAERKSAAALVASETKFASFTAAEGAATAVATGVRYLIKGFLDCGTMSIVYGPSGEGKTFVCYDLGYHLGRGRKWRGKKTRQVGVVYLATEGGQGARNRLKALAMHYGDDLSDCRMHVIAAPADFLHGKSDRDLFVDSVKAIEKVCGYKIEVIIIDTLSRVLGGGDENSSTDMGVIVKAIDWIRDQTKAHVMTVHHTGKQKDRGARGHSLLRAAADTEIEVDGGCIRVTKQRDLETGFKGYFKLKPVRIGHDTEGDEIRSCYVESLNERDPFSVPASHPADASFVALRDHVLAQSDKTKTEFTSSELIDFYGTLVSGQCRTTMQKTVKRMTDKADMGGHIYKTPDNKWVFRPADKTDNDGHLEG